MFSYIAIPLLIATLLPSRLLTTPPESGVFRHNNNGSESVQWLHTHPFSRGALGLDAAIAPAKSIAQTSGVACLPGSLEKPDWASLIKETACYHEHGYRRLEAYALSRMGKRLTQQNQPVLAIVYYKQALNLVESVRQDLRQVESLGVTFNLPRGQLQRPLVQTFSDLVYRPLADLLLQQDRLWEAQQTLDLLKIQELDDYLNNVRGAPTLQRLDNFPPEQLIAARYGDFQQNAIQLGQEQSRLQQIPDRDRSPAQQQRLAMLTESEQNLNRQFNQFIDSPEVTAQIDQLSRTARRQNLNLEDLNSLRDTLHRLGNAALLYPLILEDRLELILVTPDAPPIRRTVKVRRLELNQAIVEFRQTVTDRARNPKPSAQRLYKWLVQPLEADLKQAGIQTIIYAPDGALRYIPLAALYDGQQWLVQRYRVNYITARSLTSLATPPARQLRVLAGAFVQGSYNVQSGQRTFTFQGLPFAAKEVDGLAAIVPDTIKLIDRDFNLAAILPRMRDYGIIHFATHAAFLPGQPEDSFILFGNGDRATLRDVESWSLLNVDLVVLSACETGVGGQLGNGEEILGLGYQFQRAGARATIASLWSVDDGGTQTLMDYFYAALKQPDTTKAEALRQAQIALITGNVALAIAQPRQPTSSNPATNKDTGSEPISPQLLEHPYYWAPFILIGNGL